MTTGSEHTRHEILEASWRLLSAEDGHRTRLSDIAKEAQVSRQAIYLHFANRAELLIATTRHIDEVHDVDGMFFKINQKNGADRLTAFIEAWCGYIPIIFGGARTMLAGKDSDPDLSEAWQDRMDALWSACHSIVEELSRDAALRKDLTKKTAADILWSTISVEQWAMLTKERGWSQQRYVKTMKINLSRLLVQ